MALAASPAAAEPSGEPLPVYDGDLTFPKIESLADPGEYSWQVELQGTQTLKSVSDTEAEVEYESGMVAFVIVTQKAHDAHGTEVPTTLEVSEGDVITLVVHHREGAYVYPVREGEGFPWSGTTIIVDPPLLVVPSKTTVNPAPEPGVVPTLERCQVPALAGLTRRAAANRLRAAHCALGVVHAAPGAGTGKVVKQFHAAGAQLPAGAPVAVKLGPL